MSVARLDNDLPWQFKRDLLHKRLAGLEHHVISGKTPQFVVVGMNQQWGPENRRLVAPRAVFRVVAATFSHWPRGTGKG